MGGWVGLHVFALVMDMEAYLSNMDVKLDLLMLSSLPHFVPKCASTSKHASRSLYQVLASCVCRKCICSKFATVFPTCIRVVQNSITFTLYFKSVWCLPLKYMNLYWYTVIYNYRRLWKKIMPSETDIYAKSSFGAKNHGLFPIKGRVSFSNP